MRMLNAIIQLRRDNDYNYEKIKDSFVPMNGEVVLVDTAREGLRAKVGDGKTSYNQLSFIDKQPFVLSGYYENNKFYTNNTKSEELEARNNTIYIDVIHSQIYYFDGKEFICINEKLPNASNINAGAVKLYDSLGNATDGTITQKKITEEFNSRYKTSVKLEDELLVFSLE